MKTMKWTASMAILTLFPLCAFGQNGLTRSASTATSYDAYYSAQDAPSPSDAVSPSDAPMAEVASNDCGCTSGCDSCCRQSRCCLDCPEPEVYRIFDDMCGLECRGLKLYGWLDAGFTANSRSPVDNYNGPVTFNDREGELQVNQLYLVFEKETERDCCWSFGGRVDLMYGSDHRFTMARGLETHRDFSNKWNGERFYGLALPQAYLQATYNDLDIKLGHFYTIIGYEGVMAPSSFFYSHSLTHTYAEPFTHTGALASYKLNDRWSVSAGFHRGWDNWDDYPGNDQLDFLGGVTWTSCDENTSLAFAITSGEEQSIAGFAPRTMYSLVYSHKFNDCLTYVLQHDRGVQQDGVAIAGGPNQDADWYGINQYLFYQINCCWAAGVRFEWFRDDDGTRVVGLGDGNLATGPFEGDFYAITLGANWKPNDNVTIRPELRFDWFEGQAGANPFDGGAENDQTTAAVDVVIAF